MRGERTESPFANSTPGTDPALQPVAVDGFYRYMADLGLKYGEEFRAVREMAAAKGEFGRPRRAVGSQREARGRDPLHPVLLDGALHALPRLLDRRSARRGAQLPVRFGRILFLRSPGASAQVRASVLQCNDEFVEGRLALYGMHKRPAVRAR